jgi:large subunit ribosomal protein L21
MPAFSTLMTTYAIISLGGKQYRVQAGQRLLVDRLPEAEGATITPRVLLVGGDGDPVLGGAEGAVTARVLGPQRGPKLRIGKYRQRTGFRKHTGFRAALTQIEIESVGAAVPKRARSAKPAAPEPEAAAEAAAEAEKPKRARTAKPAAAGPEAAAEAAAEKPKRTRTAKPKGADDVEAPAETQEEES